MQRLLSIIGIAWMGIFETFAQDPQFSQFYSNPLYLAPSFAGAAGGNRICANVRDQWFSLPATFMTYSFSFDSYLPKYNSGFGLLAYKDVAGTGQLGTLNMGVQYSYNFKIFETVYIRPGLHFAYRENGVAWDKLKFIGEVMTPDRDNTEPPPVDKTRDVDFAMSTLVYTGRFWSGFTIDHILRPNMSLYADKTLVPVKMSIFGGVEVVKKSRLLRPTEETMTIAYLFKKQGPYYQLDLGVYWYKNPLVLGLWYRGIPPFNSQRGDALIILVGYKSRNFNMGYSYDLPVSNLIGQAIGSHEVSMSVKFAMPRRYKKGEVPCPEF